MTWLPPSTTQAWRTAEPAVLEGFHRAASDLGAPSRLRLALFEAGLVESGFRNLAGGDRDSVGPLQQRRGWGPLAARRDPYLAALAFLRDAQRRVLPDYPADGSAGRLAQAVQRSAYPERYDLAEQAARYVMDRSKGMADWHLAPSLAQLFREVNERWPRRSKAYDGTIGDRAHAARTSEHNPDHDSDPMPTGAVSAADVTTKGIAKREVLDALIGDARVWYVIHDGVIYSRTYGWKPRKYTGSNPHEHHIHVSLRQTKAAHDSRKSWGIASATKDGPVEPKTPEPVVVEHPAGSRVTRRGHEGEDVKFLQRYIAPEGRPLVQDGIFGPATEKAVKWYQKMRGLPLTGVVDRATWAQMGIRR